MGDMDHHRVLTINSQVGCFETGSSISESSLEVPDCLEDEDRLFH